MDYELSQNNPYQRDMYRAMEKWLKSYNQHVRYRIHMSDEALSCFECGDALRYYDEQLHRALNWEDTKNGQK